MDDMLRQLVAQVPQAARLPLLICLVAFAGWGVLYLLAMVATRPLPVRPGPATHSASDGPGTIGPSQVTDSSVKMVTSAVVEFIHSSGD